MLSVVNPWHSRLWARAFPCPDQRVVPCAWRFSATTVLWPSTGPMPLAISPKVVPCPWRSVVPCLWRISCMPATELQNSAGSMENAFRTDGAPAADSRHGPMPLANLVQPVPCPWRWVVPWTWRISRLAHFGCNLWGQRLRSTPGTVSSRVVPRSWRKGGPIWLAIFAFGGPMRLLTDTPLAPCVLLAWPSLSLCSCASLHSQACAPVSPLRESLSNLGSRDQ